MSFQVSEYRMETGKLLYKIGNCEENSMETISLKALANKVLQRNLQGNQKETLSFQQGNCKGDNVSLKEIGCKIHSELLDCCLWIVEDDEDMKTLRHQGIADAIYTAPEIRKLKGLNKEALKTAHRIKDIFKDSKVNQVKLVTQEVNE